VAALRVPPAEAARGFSGYWMAPASARYRFSWPRASGAALYIDGRRLDQVTDKGAVSVAGGLHRLLYRPGPKPTALTWARIGAREKDPSAAGGLWRLPWGTYLPRVPPVVMVGIQTAPEVAVGQMPADSEVPEYVDEFMDLAGHGGKIYVASVGRHLVRRVLVGKELRLEPVLRSAGGGAYDHADGGSVEYLLPGYRLGDINLAVSGAGFFVLDRRQGRILRFGPDGRLRAVLQGPWVAPSDLDATVDGLYVSDPGRGQVLLVDPAGGRQPRVLVSGVDPVSLAVQGRNLVYLDRRLQQLAIRGLGPGQGSETRVQLRAVRGSTRVAAGPDGVLAVCDPVDYSVFLFTAEGRLLAVDGVPRLMSGEFGSRDLGSRPVAALLRGDDLVVMASDGQAYLMEVDLEAAIRAAAARP
jgi:hypothetical protein